MSGTDLAGLYRDHREGLVRAAAGLLGDRAAAEDVVQETWVRALGAYGGAVSAGGGLPPPAWLYRVALNLCYDRLRAAKRSRTVPVSTAEIELVDSPRDNLSAEVGGDPEAALLATEVAEAVRGAIDSLPGALREVVLLREYGDLKYREIAQAVGCPVGTVMSRLHLARQRLRRVLAPYLDLELGALPPAQGAAAASGSERQESDGHAARG